MRPKRDDLDDFFFLVYFVNQTVLVVDAPGVQAVHVADELFIGRRRLIGVLPNDFDQGLGFFVQVRGF